jgi:hypothetical protein
MMAMGMVALIVIVMPLVIAVVIALEMATHRAKTGS